MSLHYQQTILSRFNKAKARGRRKVSWLVKLFSGDKSLLSLKELTTIAPPLGESYIGTEDIHIYKIAGTEDRTKDFAEGFLPVHGWMSRRWIKIYDLMSKNQLEEPIKVLEYGGLYFVRDGHHRVSTGRNLGRIFIRAHITRLKTHYVLPFGFNHSRVKHFKKMVQFNKKTHLLDSVPEMTFDINRMKTWHLLEKELTLWNPSWHERHKDLESQFDSPVLQQKDWYNHTYKKALDFVNERSIRYLFPRWGDTDIIMEIINVWNSYPDPDKFWYGEVYSLFLKRYRQQRFFLTPLQFIADFGHFVLNSAFDERSRFLRMSNIKNIRPEFRVPADTGMRYWRKLYKEVFRDHAQNMKKQLGRAPYLQEIVEDWYDNVWLPKTEM